METPNLSDSPDGKPNETVEKVIIELKLKAKENHKKANLYFNVVLAVIGAGLLVFIFAYRFTSNIEIQNSLQTSRDLLKTEFQRFDKYLDSVTTATVFKAGLYDSIAYVTIIGQTYFDYDSVVEKYMGLYSADYPNPSSTGPNLANDEFAQSLRDSLNPVVDRYFAQVNTSIMDGLKTSNFELYNLINTVVIRFGSIVILLFLVQILVRVFRYNTRLANFYSARANALELYLKEPEKFKLDTLIASLSPDILDIGVQKNPSEQLLELAKLFAKER